MEKKKVLFVITKSNFGGAQRYVLDLARCGKERYKIDIVTGSAGPLTKALEAEGVKTHILPEMVRDIGFLREIRVLKRLFKLFRAERPNVVHLNSSKAAGLGSLAARLSGVRRIVFTVHGWPFHEHRPWWWLATAWIGSWLTALLSHRIICVSKYDTDHSYMPFTARKIQTIQNGVSSLVFKERTEAREELFAPETQKQHVDDLWLITNAELTQNKNLFTAIDAVTAYNKKADRKIFYSIMGDGELREELERHVTGNNAGAYVCLLGFVQNAPAFLKAFDIFLLPSKKEGLPYALLEAGAAQLPTVASRVGGIPDIIEHKKNGLFVDPFDHIAMANALEVLTNDDAFRHELGKRLHETVSVKFSLERMVEETFRVYEN